MNTKQNNSLSIEQLYCTEKAHFAIQGYSHGLSARERQFLLLLKCTDTLGLNACSSLLDKVNVPSLLSRGYLSLHDEVNATAPLAVIADDMSPVLIDADPRVQLVSGNFS